MIKPYYQTELGKLYHGDCLEVLPQLTEKVDLILTDPPYNISQKGKMERRENFDSPIMRRNKAINYDFGEWDIKERGQFLRWVAQWLKEVCNLLKDNGAILSFFSKEDISYMGWCALKYGIRTRTILTWHKTNPVPSFRKVNYLSACEFIWVGSKGKDKWTFNFQKQKEMHNFFETGNSSGYSESNHPTEKPMSLISQLLTIHSNRNDLILDPFLGSGTTAVACERLGRKWIGVEQSEEYCKMAVGRIKREYNQIKLIGA